MDARVVEVSALMTVRFVDPLLPLCTRSGAGLYVALML